MSIVDRARALRDTVEELSVHLDDGAAVENAELFPVWSGDSVQYTVGQRLRYDGVLYKVLQAHTSSRGGCLMLPHPCLRRCCPDRTAQK